jgi:hypothetical protein
MAAPAWLRKLGPTGVAALAAWKLVGAAKFASVLSLLASFALHWRTWGLALVVGVLRALSPGAPAKPDPGVLALFAAVTAALAMLRPFDLGSTRPWGS